MVIYLAIGLAGVPWFAGMTGGIGIIIGANGGFLIGFILAALFLGHFTDKYINARSFMPMLGILMFASFSLIYIPGLIQLSAWLYLVNGTVPGIWSLLVMGLLPFIVGDIVKIGGVAALAKAVMPKESFNEERIRLIMKVNGKYSDPIRIRAHHLLCMQGFQGYGYSKDFERHMGMIITFLNSNPSTAIQIITSVDEICSKCPYCVEGKCAKRIRNRKN